MASAQWGRDGPVAATLLRLNNHINLNNRENIDLKISGSKFMNLPSSDLKDQMANLEARINQLHSDFELRMMGHTEKLDDEINESCHLVFAITIGMLTKLGVESIVKLASDDYREWKKKPDIFDEESMFRDSIDIGGGEVEYCHGMGVGRIFTRYRTMLRIAIESPSQTVLDEPDGEIPSGQTDEEEQPTKRGRKPIYTNTELRWEMHEKHISDWLDFSYDKGNTSYKEFFESDREIGILYSYSREKFEKMMMAMSKVPKFDQCKSLYLNWANRDSTVTIEKFCKHKNFENKKGKIKSLTPKEMGRIIRDGEKFEWPTDQ